MAGIRRITALAAAAVCALGATAAGANDMFRPLEIDGAEVRWLPATGNAPVTLRYAVANAEIKTAQAVNCGRTGAPDRLAANSNLRAADFRWATREAIARWQRAANITFVETLNANDADIVIGEQMTPRGLAFTNLVLAPSTGGRVRGIAKAQICLNPDKRWNLGFDGNLTTYALVHAITHEIGHAIGLDHPGARGHLMSFRYLETYDGLSQGDALGAVSLYGAKQPQADRATLSAPANFVR